jgi:antibiotic biosynthesis monooxygenase (ABM) superfamily enzyme
MLGRTGKKTTMATSKRVLPESDTPWSLMIISVGKRGEEKQYQQWLERTASTAIDATGFLGTRIFQPYAGAREYIRQICFDSKGHLETWAHSACTEIAGRDHEEFIEYCDIQPIETVADANSQPSVPRRKQWKQFLLTVGAVYLLILIISMLISAISHSVPVVSALLLRSFISASFIVTSLTFVVLPIFNRWFNEWLSR